ncbi:MAG: right-handed parallel beta-helix repeat-containing protein [Bacteroidia bacterium]
MKKFILALCIFACTESTTKASNYYFSSTNGDDSRSAAQAQKASTPWKTIDKLNDFFTNLQGGDSVLFNRGDEFVGSIKITKSGITSKPIVLSSYGSVTKNMPVITGLVTLTNWVSVGNNIWVTNFSTANSSIVNTFLINNSPYAMGRFPNVDKPNKGFLNFESHNGNTQITDNELGSTPDWTGGEMVIRPNRWCMDRNLIRAHSGNTLTYTSSSGYTPHDNFGYFIQNHLKTLDQFGEWYHDKNANKLYVYINIKPTSYTIQTGSYDVLVNIASQSNITFNNLSFIGANTEAFKINNAQNIEIKNSKILYSGVNGITATNTKGATVENCNINGSNNTALSFYSDCSNTTIRNNTIKNSGVVDGMCKSGNNMSEGISLSGNNNLVEYNTIDSTGYIGIFFYGNDVTIKNNFVNYFNISKDDGAGIYTWVGTDLTTTWKNRKVVGNIVLNGIGAGAGTNSASEAATEGIYMDDNTGEVDILNNTVANCADNGIFLHDAHNIKVMGNTLFNNLSAQIYVSQSVDCSNCDTRGLNVTNNLFVSKYNDQLSGSFRSLKSNISNFGSFDSNYYCRPFDDNLVILSEYINTGKTVKNAQNIATWQTNFSQDKNSKRMPFIMPPSSFDGVIGSNLFTNSGFSSNTNGTSAYTGQGVVSASWDNTGKLDGASLKCTYTSSAAGTAIIYINVGNVVAGKSYVLKYSLLGVKNNKIIKNYLMQNVSPYSIISNSTTTNTSTSRTENQVVFTSTKTDNNVSVMFAIDETVGAFYIDNVVFQEARVTTNSPDNNIRFEYNATKSAKNINLSNNTYRDVKNNLYVGSVTLAPYTSIILIKIGVSTNIQGSISNPNTELNVYPNPSRGKFYISNTDFTPGNEVSVVLYNSIGSVVFSKVVPTEDQIFIDTEDNVRAGVYVVVATTNNKSYKKRVVLID